jgi:pimeloyl-ACP methyl ester carboxylesterase
MRRWAVIASLTLLWLAVGLIVIAAGFRVAADWRETADVATLAPSSGKHVATRSGRVFLQEAGPADGIPVVLFHGTAAWSELWRGTMTALGAAGYRAIALDIPPFGFSDRPGIYTRTSHAERVSDVLDALAVKQAIIVGHSFGAGAATETVMRFGDRVRGLVLVDAALGLDDSPQTKPPAITQTGWVREALLAMTATNPMLTRYLLSTLIAKKERAAHYVDVLQKPMTLRNTTPDLGVWLLYFLGHDGAALSADRKSYAAITAKTAILWGDMDTVTPLSQGEELRRLIPGATLTVLRGLGHIPQIEEPETFHRALIARLDEMK